MASSTQECKELIDIAQEQNLTLMVGHTFVYSSIVRKIKEIIDHGDLGEIQYISSRRLNLGLFQNDINVAWDLAPHDITIILYSPYVKQEEPLKIECQHFLDCIKTGGRSESDGLEGLKVVQILEAASKSLENGGGRVIIDTQEG